jgi:dihydroorotase
VSSGVLLRGGTVLDATGSRRADVAVLDGLIVAVDGRIEPRRGWDELDCGGCLVTPGLVDLQAHLREPGTVGAETIDSGTRAAALGGVTAVVCMPNTNPTVDHPELVRWVRERGRLAGWCEVAPAAAITVDRRGERLTDMAGLWEAGVRVFTDDGTAVMDAALMRAAFEKTRTLRGAVLGQHAEDAALVDGGHLHEGDVSAMLGIRGRPAVAEEVIVARDLLLARETGARYHVLHVSAAGTVAMISAARSQGVRVTAEVTPQHLVLTDEALLSHGSLCKMNPPLRSEGHRAALRHGLAGGVIDAIATDHAPHPDEHKLVSIEQAAPGMRGLETMCAIVLTHLVTPGLLTLEAAIGAMSWRPAAIAGLDRHGGPVSPGRPANLAVIDRSESWTVDPEALGLASANNPFVGARLRGRVRHTLFEGRPVVVDSAAVTPG